MLGLVPSSAAANNNLSPLSSVAKVDDVPEPDTYLNSTVKEPVVEFLKKIKSFYI